MPLDAQTAAARLRAAGTADVPALVGAPPRDLRRSPAAAQVARHAARAGLFLTHYEHRAQLELPWAWLAPGSEGDAAPPQWRSGVLPERKYQSFRHDQALGSMHPGHRGKWSTHELCHGLVGHAWAPDATPFFLATAGRLAELLPVALYYFFDEAFLRRCPDHDGGGALFRSFCPACEELASFDPDAPGAVAFIEQGLDFIDRELAAVARSRRLGRPISHRFATLDLASDGVAYALAHGPRLSSPEFARWSAAFDRQRSEDLDALEQRVLDVTAAVLGEPLVDPPHSAEVGRLRAICGDLAWRLFTVQADTDGDAARQLEGILEDLADDAQAGHPQGPLRAVQAYRALCDEWELLPPEDLEAVGYALPGLRPRPVLAEGLLTACPLSSPRADVAAFAAHDLASPERRPLAERWLRWLPFGGLLRELAAYEAALVTTGREVALPGGDGTVRLARGARVLRFSCDPGALASAPEGPLQAEGEPVALGFVRGADGDLVVAELDPDAAQALLTLGEGAPSPLGEEATAALLDLGLIVPARWTERA